MPRTVITFGTYDVFHIGHLRVIERAAALGDQLVVGVSSDELTLKKKDRAPVFSQSERLAIVAAMKPVTRVFLEESLESRGSTSSITLLTSWSWAMTGRVASMSTGTYVRWSTSHAPPAVSTTALIEKIAVGDLSGPDAS